MYLDYSIQGHPRALGTLGLKVLWGLMGSKFPSGLFWYLGSYSLEGTQYQVT